jgi:ABC-type polysaccharide/polyol phosphate export permease
VAASTAIRGNFAAGARSTSSAWDLLLALTIRDLRVKYHGTVLSYLWWLARPLALGLIMYFALGHVLQVSIPHYAIFLLAALFPWFWFQGALGAATGSFLGNSGLVKKVYFPRAILPLSAVLGQSFEFLATLPVLIVLIIANGIDPAWAWLAGVPLLFAIQICVLAGLGTMLACINVFFRDTSPGLDSFLTLLFYATPIIYPLAKVPSDVRPLMNLNPMVPLIEGWRTVFVDGEMPGLELWPAAVFAAVALALGALTLRYAGKNMADAL